MIAEGIESIEQMSVLNFLGCDYGQGFIIARPQDSKTIEALLKKQLSIKLLQSAA